MSIYPVTSKVLCQLELTCSGRGGGELRQDPPRAVRTTTRYRAPRLSPFRLSPFSSTSPNVTSFRIAWFQSPAPTWDGLDLRCFSQPCISPYVKHADGAVEWIEASGPPPGQGLGSRAGYRETVKPLAKGDMVVLTSDGVVEARDRAGELFGFPRLEDAIAAGPSSSTEAMLDHLQAELAAFVGDQDPHDDVTMAVLGI
jgi:hypothetical protein